MAATLVFAVFLSTCSKVLSVGTYASQQSLTSTDRDNIVLRVNQMRNEIQATDMTELSWDPQLESFALDKAKKCTFNQPASYTNVVGHNTVGLNMFATSESPAVQKPVDAALKDWWSKQEFYTYGPYQSGQCRNKEACANYVQMVTSLVNKIGCASVNCSVVEGAGPVKIGAVAICAFSPDIVKGRYPYSKGEKCSSCNLRCTNSKSYQVCAYDSTQSSPSEIKLQPTRPTPTPQRGPICTDLFPLCSFWAQAGQCTKNPTYMMGNCSAACGRCEPKKVLLSCDESGPDCQDWQAEGLCMSNPHFMIWQCPQICGFCSVSGAIPYPPLIRA